MTPVFPRPMVIDDTPRAASISEAQSTVAVAERDMALLVAAVAMVLNQAVAPALGEVERARLRTLNTVLFRQLSARAQQEVRERVEKSDGLALKQSA